MKRTITCLATLGAALILASCTTEVSVTDDTAEASVVDVTDQAQQDAEAMARIGEQATSGGIALTVTSVDENSEVSLYASGRKQGTSPDEIVQAPAGAKYVTVHTEVVNESSEPWDLTCGGAIRAILATPDGDTYDPEGELYRIHGNPECSDTIGPGLSSPMSWMFVVPQDATPGALGFTDYTSDLTLVALVERT